MKKTLVRVLILLLAAMLAFSICMVPDRGKLSFVYEIPPEATEAEITFEPAGIVTVESIAYDTADAACTVVLAAAAGVTRDADGSGSGSTAGVPSGIVRETVMRLHWDHVDSSGFYTQDLENPLKLLPGSVILDTVTLNFSGWENVVLALEGLLFVLAGVLLLEFAEETRRSGQFSYRRVRLLGFAMFFLVLALIRLPSAVSSFRDPDPGTIWSLLVGLFASARSFMAETAPVVIVFAAAICVSNIALLIREGVCPVNFLGIAIGAVMTGGALIGTELHYSRLVFFASNEVIGVYAGLFVYFECHLGATVNCALQAALSKPSYDVDYIVILGCRIRPDGTLYPLIRGRVDRALRFAEEQERRTGTCPVLVPSGGKGSDEIMAEGDAMAAYLRSKGVPEDRILVENRSATTKENMLFSRRLIEAQRKNSRVAFCTSGYHVFRGGILASSTGWKIRGMGSGTKWYYWPNAFLREFIGLLADSWISQLITIGIITAVSIALMRLL